MYVYICIHTYTHIYINIFIHAYTYIYTYIHKAYIISWDDTARRYLDGSNFLCLVLIQCARMTSLILYLFLSPSSNIMVFFTLYSDRYAINHSTLYDLKLGFSVDTVHCTLQTLCFH